jgi:predicted nucleic acid-binding protein
MIVVDATVAAKWYLVENGTAAAFAVLQNSEALAAPDLILSEVAGAITRRVRVGALTAAQATPLLAQWHSDLDLGFLRLEPFQHDLVSAERVALSTAHPLMDCIYIACAMRLGATLVTADQKLHRRGLTAYTSIELLA